jgi:hypothetical protein
MIFYIQILIILTLMSLKLVTYCDKVNICTPDEWEANINSLLEAVDNGSIDEDKLPFDVYKYLHDWCHGKEDNICNNQQLIVWVNNFCEKKMSSV